MYAKLFTSIYQGTLRGDSHGLLVFTNLLAHCDQGGIADIHPKAIAEEIGLTVEQVKAAIERLEAPDEESRTPDEEGRRIVRMDEHRAWGWRVVNYGKYRAIRNEDDRREQNRLAQERWRNRNKQNKPPSAEVSHGKPKEKEKEKEKEKKEGTARKRAKSAHLGIEDVVADGVSRQHAFDWMAVRQAKSMPLTLTAWEETKAEAAKAGIPVDAAIRTAAAHGWAGFRASWLHSADTPTNGSRVVAKPSEPAWRREQRERNEAFAGPYAAKSVFSKPTEVIDALPKLLD